MEKAGVHWGAVTIYSHVQSLIHLKDTQGHLNMLTVTSSIRVTLKAARPGVLRVGHNVPFKVHLALRSLPQAARLGRTFGESRCRLRPPCHWRKLGGLQCGDVGLKAIGFSPGPAHPQHMRKR